MAEPKRTHDRQSGTGRPIKETAKREGGGKGNWGGAEQAIEDGIAQQEVPPADAPVRKQKKRKDPETMGDLTNQEDQTPAMSFDEFMKAKKEAAGTKAFVDLRGKKGEFKKTAPKSSKREQVTDDLFAGAQKQKKRRAKKKKAKRTIDAQFSFEKDAPADSGDRKPGMGRGDGDRDRGFGGGPRQYDQRQSRGAGFGSRGRGGGDRGDMRQSSQQQSGVGQPA